MVSAFFDFQHTLNTPPPPPPPSPQKKLHLKILALLGSTHVVKASYRKQLKTLTSKQMLQR